MKQVTTFLLLILILISFKLNAQTPFFTLEHVRGSDDVVMDTITNNSIIIKTNATTFTVNAKPITSTPIGSTRLILAGPITHNQIEAVAPYLLYGDNANGFTNGPDLIVGSYTLTVSAWSGSGATGTKIGEDTVNFTVVELDTQAPTPPILSMTSKMDITVDLSWTTSTDNIGVVGYKVYRNNVLETTLGNDLTYQVMGLTAATAYNFTVTSIDAQDNESASSNILTVTTNASSGGGGGYWSLNNQDVFYTNGNVGIGTSIPDGKLTVKGSIHSEEVKVDLSIAAPDYVFKADYNLVSLKQLQEYIITHGHLPNIPSAKDMETHGIELGIMNMKLLEKIEELTLYILEQEKRLKEVEGLIIKKL